MPDDSPNPERRLPAKMTPAQIIEDAEITATFFRNIVLNGVPVSAAISMTSTYIQTVVLGRISQQKPQEPWE